MISSNTSKRVVSHRIMLSKDLTIHKNGCNSIYLSPPDDHVFELFDVDPDTAAKLLSLNRYQGVIFKEGINSKLKQEFAKRLSKEEPLSDNPVTDRKYEKVVYIKVKTRTDIPEGAKYDDQTGGKIVYVIEDED
ncbi:MAG TPA: hypothetical protein P5198_10180 [Flexilinea sp.]|nr:hypothetical protein [Flexilinea sp.]